MPDFPIVDSHVHLCDPQRFDYPWMKRAPSLNRQVLPQHLTQAAAPVVVDQFVFVEVDVAQPQHVAEAEWVSGLARSDPRLKGIVAALPLELGLAVEPDLDRLTRLRELRSIRRLIQNQPDPDFCIQPDFIAGLKLLARYDVAFDICIFHHHLPNTIRMVSQCPEVRFVLDHIGKPRSRTGCSSLGPQHEGTRALAERALQDFRCGDGSRPQELVA
jgi:L-fuconolactonase